LKLTNAFGIDTVSRLRDSGFQWFSTHSVGLTLTRRLNAGSTQYERPRRVSDDWK